MNAGAWRSACASRPRGVVSSSASIAPPARRHCHAYEPQQRTAAGEHASRGSDHAGGLEQDLRRARRHHARQRPARNRKRPLQRAGRRGSRRARARSSTTATRAAARYARAIDVASSSRSSDHTLAPRHVRAPERANARTSARAAPVVVAENVGARERRSRDAAVDLAARRRLLVEQRRRGRAPRDRRGRESGRTGADDREVERASSSRTSPGALQGHLASSARAPCCVATCMPGARRPCTPGGWAGRRS